MQFILEIGMIVIEQNEDQMQQNWAKYDNQTTTQNCVDPSN